MACPAGTYTNDQKLSSCRSCEAGKSSAGEGASSCLDCSQVSAVAPGNGTTSCTRCPDLTDSDGLSCKCRGNTYASYNSSISSLNDKTGTHFSCLTCPDDLICESNNMTNKANTWVYVKRDNQSRIIGQPNVFVCPPDACLERGKCSAHRKDYAKNPLWYHILIFCSSLFCVVCS
jgi:hypothetical protein